MRQFWLTLALLLLPFLAGPAYGEHFRLALNTTDDHYLADILRLALRAEGGSHSVETIPRILLVQTRALEQLNDPDRRYDVHYSGYLPLRADLYSMVKFPITRGMLGHRLLAVTAANRDMFADVRSLADLQRLAILGAGNDWPDADIMRAAGLTVITATDSVLWPMLAKDRFNAFPRGINEIDGQIAHEGDGRYGTKLVIEPHLMLEYRFDLFFFLPRDEAKKAAIIEAGLKAAYKNGTLDLYLETSPAFADILANLKRHNRRVIHLPNPVMDERRSGIPDRYWRSWP